MNEDSMTYSMAQKALTGVNGGTSVPTPEVNANEPVGPGKANRLDDGLGSQMESAIDVARRTVSRLSGGLPRGRLGTFDRNAVSVFDANRNKGSPLGATNPSKLLAELLTQQAIVKQQNQSLGGGAAYPYNPERNADRINQTPEIDLRPLNERMTTIRPIGGGAAILHYDYNGVMVALPDGVDANDANTVGAAMAEQNAIIDMMNGMNDEED